MKISTFLNIIKNLIFLVICGAFCASCAPRVAELYTFEIHSGVVLEKEMPPPENSLLQEEIASLYSFSGSEHVTYVSVEGRVGQSKLGVWAVSKSGEPLTVKLVPYLSPCMMTVGSKGREFSQLPDPRLKILLQANRAKDCVSDGEKGAFAIRVYSHSVDEISIDEIGYTVKKNGYHFYVDGI